MKPTTLRALTMLSLAFPAMKLDDEARMEVWSDALDDVPEDALLAAVAVFTRTSENPFGPTIGQVRAKALGAPAEDEAEGLAASAWQAVTAEVQRVGYCGQPRFGDLVTEHAAHVLGTWRKFCTCDVSDLPSHRARFIQTYVSVRRQLDRQELLPADLRAICARQRERFLAGMRTDPARRLASGGLIGECLSNGRIQSGDDQ